MNHDPKCCAARGCHLNICSHGQIQPDGSLKCGTWQSLADPRKDPVFGLMWLNGKEQG